MLLNKNFTKLFVSNAVSSLGNWLDMVAILVLFSYGWQTSPILLAMIPVMYALPGVLFSQWAGVIADRYNNLKILIYTDFIRAALTVLLVLTDQPYWVLAILLLRAGTGIFNFPSFQVLTNRIVDRSQLTQATSYNMIVGQFSKVLGPLLGGVLVAAFSADAIFALNAISFALSGLLLMFVKFKKDPVEQPAQAAAPRETMWSAIKAGWLVLFEHKLLLSGTLFFLAGFCSIHLIESQVNILLRTIAPDQEALIGYSIALFGIGTILSSLLLKRVKNMKPFYGWLLGGGMLLIGISFGGMGLLETTADGVWVYPLSLVGGIGVGFTFLGFNNLIHHETPQDSIGRVFGITQSLTSLILLAAPITGGLLVQTAGVHLAMQISGIGLGVIGITGLLLRHRLGQQRSINTQKTGAQL